MSEEHQEQSTETERRPPPAGTNGVLGGPGQSQNGADTGVDDAETADAPPPSWREDWRTALAAGDEKKAKALQRYASPENFAKAAFEARDKITRGITAAEPPEDATEVELKEWRKQAGVPETPDGYQIAFPDGVTAGDRDKEELGAFLKFMHDKHIAPRAAKAAFEFYMTSRAAGAEQAGQAAEEATLENLAELRKTYPGREYKRSIGLANDFLNGHFAGPDAQTQLDTILAARLPNGVQLTNYAPFVQMVVAMARASASEDDLVAGDAGGGARSVDEEFKELAKKPQLTDTERARMEQLAQARITRQERAAAR
jgi:hypothetical protein